MNPMNPMNPMPPMPLFSATTVLRGVAFLALLCTVLLPAWSDAPDDIGLPRPPSGPPGLPHGLPGVAEGRCLTYVATDKPVYRTGEKVYVRGVVLDAATHAPLPADAPPQALVQVVGPKGDVVASGYVNGQDSVLGFAWDVPAEQAGGEYTAKVTLPLAGLRAGRAEVRRPRLPCPAAQEPDRLPPRRLRPRRRRRRHAARRARRGRHPRRRQGHRHRAGGRGRGVQRPGRRRSRGQLHRPLQAARSRSSAARGRWRWRSRTAAWSRRPPRPSPSCCRPSTWASTPRAATWSPGLANRVYFEARTPAQKPADLAGVVIDAAGKEVAPFRTEHEGRGRFEFTPAKGEKYALKISQPAGHQADVRPAGREGQPASCCGRRRTWSARRAR